MDIIFLARDHWRWLALAGHRIFARALDSLKYRRPDVIICSGPASGSNILTALRLRWGQVAGIAYFHESQWTYPARDFDPRPYLVGHLESIEAFDQVWFNSRFHQEDFRIAALASPSTRLQELAQEVVEENWHRTRVLYPPVHVHDRLRGAREKGLTITWAARWEREKRPDIFIRALKDCADRGLEPVVHLLGAPSGLSHIENEIPAEIRKFISPMSGFPARSTYETLLAQSNIWVSTAEHEFFGVAALEAALLGAVPVLPRALAYQETLPSAPSYSPGDCEDLARSIMAASHHSFQSISPWGYDAARFRGNGPVNDFDRLVKIVTDAR